MSFAYSRWILGAVLGACVGCGDDASNATDGSGGGGTGGASDGGGGSAASCPADSPTDGTPCDETDPCDYDIALPACAASFTAICEAGAWSSKKPASCGVLDEPACDPIGTHALAYGAWSDEEPASAPPTSLVLQLDDDGVVVTTAPEAFVSADGCTVTARWSDEWCEEDLCEETRFELELDFSLSPPAGIMTFECTGECDVQTTAPVTVE